MRCGPGLHVADSALVKARGPLGAEYPFERCSCRPIKGLRAARTDDEQGHAKNRVASRRLWTSITFSARNASTLPTQWMRRCGRAVGEK